MFFFELPNNFWTNKKNQQKKSKKKKNAILARNTESKQWILKKKGVISTLK